MERVKEMISLDTDILVRYLTCEVSEEIAQALLLYRRREAEFCDLMTVSAAKRAGARSVYTLDRKFSQIEGVSLLDARMN